MPDFTSFVKAKMPRIVSQTFVDQRRSLCDACENKKVVFGADVCGLCGCWIPAKIKISSTSCPGHKWGPVDAL